MATIPSASVLWLAIVDFNVIFSFEEKKGGSSSGIRNPYFGEFVDSNGLHDLGFKGPLFTWHIGDF